MRVTSLTIRPVEHEAVMAFRKLCKLHGRKQPDAFRDLVKFGATATVEKWQAADAAAAKVLRS